MEAYKVANPGSAAKINWLLDVLESGVRYFNERWQVISPDSMDTSKIGNCNGAVVDDEYKSSSSEFDLLMVVTCSVDAAENWVARAGSCATLSNRPVFGSMEFNLSHIVQNNLNYFYYTP